MAPLKYINIGLLAHVDAGKTTLTEHLLYRGGALRAPGSIEKGDTQTDRLAVERERGISVRSASASLTYRGVRINIIDTPGHIDFTGEAERALSVLDAAVLVVSAAEGIQSQTEIFWKALRGLGVPVVIFINKIDRAGCDPESVYAALRDEFSQNVFALNSALSPGGRGCGTGPPAFTDDDALALCELDEGLAEAYLSSDGEIEGAQLAQAAERLSAEGAAYPLFYGSAALGVGVSELLDAIPRCFRAAELTDGGAARGVVFKIEHDSAMGKAAYVRLFSGALRSREAVSYVRRGAAVTAPAGGAIGSSKGAPSGNVAGGGAAVTINSAPAGADYMESAQPVINKISQIKSLSGAKLEDSGIVCGGDSAVVFGLADARAGDVIMHAENPLIAAPPLIRDADALDARLRLHERMRLAEPLFSVRAEAGAGEEHKLLLAAAEFADEDPLLEYEWEPDERELILKVMGEIQLEILETLFKERHGLAVRFSPPTVIYKETPIGRGVGLEEYTMPKPCWAVVQLEAAPLPRGAGYEFESVIKANALPYRYQHHVETAIPGALKQGMFNWEVTDLKMTLIGGEHHHVHTHPLDFFLATPIAVMKALQDAGTRLLEPMALYRMTAGEELAGRIIGDIASMRGAFDSPVVRGGRVTIEAMLPVSESISYPVRFASLTSGKGVMRTSFAGYSECPAGVGAPAKRRGVNPLDRMRWILYKRNAL